MRDLHRTLPVSIYSAKALSKPVRPIGMILDSKPFIDRGPARLPCSRKAEQYTYGLGRYFVETNGYGRSTVSAAVLLSPSGQFQQRWAQGPAIGGESVLRAKDGPGKDAALDQSISFELP